MPGSPFMGGASEYSYSYDELYRLKEASGSYTGANDSHSYTLAMQYNTVGGITQKTQEHLRKGEVQTKTSYALGYAYGTEQPNAPIQIGEQVFAYDANGNQTSWEDQLSGQRRELLWDEENRIRAIFDNGQANHYIYDASGERVIKGKSTGQTLYVNGEKKGASGNMGNYTIYVNPYVVLQSGSYTKHYYIEGQRIVSKLGGGWDHNPQGQGKAGENSVNYSQKQEELREAIVKNLKFLGLDGQILTAGKSGKIPPGQVKGTGNGAENFQYYYHPDHLGSTSYITDITGEVYQHLETEERGSRTPLKINPTVSQYFAFGETFVEEHSNTNRTPYKFNGKELDEETGLYYYGARYYDARTSVWLSVDPRADEMPGITSFSYSANNPVNLIDPDGRIPIAPILWWAGRRAAAGAIVDIMVQFTSEWVSGGGTMGQAWNRLEIDAFQVARSAGENLVKGKYSSAALSAAGDMLAYMMDNEDWTWEGAILAAGEGGISSILGDKLAGELLKKIKVKDGVIFSADLSEVNGKSRSAHRNAANKQLEAAMSDPNTRELIELYDPKALDNVKRSVKPGNNSATRRNPAGTEWDHNTNNPNQIDLRTKSNHAKKTSQDPGRQGGYSLYYKNNNE